MGIFKTKIYLKNFRPRLFENLMPTTSSNTNKIKEVKYENIREISDTESNSSMENLEDEETLKLDKSGEKETNEISNRFFIFTNNIHIFTN